MKPEEQRIAIAEACGWKRTGYQPSSLQVRADVPFWTDGKLYLQAENLPDYLHDLNAMHEAIGVLNRDQQIKFGTLIIDIADKANENRVDTFHIVNATAAQRAEAFLRALNLWNE